MQHWQEEAARQRALREQTSLEKDSQLAGTRAELLVQSQQLDGCQARVSVSAGRRARSSPTLERYSFSSAQVSYLEVEVETLTEQLQSPEAGADAENGSVTVDDLDHVQKANRDLEQQLGDKNRVSCLFFGTRRQQGGRHERAAAAAFGPFSRRSRCRRSPEAGFVFPPPRPSSSCSRG